MHIKEQQQQLLRLQQAAKNNLYEMEQIRLQQPPLSFNNTTGNNAATTNGAGGGSGGAGGGSGGAVVGSGGDSMPDYENETDVQNDVRALMSRIKNLSDFVRNQDELATSLGIEDNEKPELLEEQLQLQKKLEELKTKKQQMANLVNELQSMNVHAENNFDVRGDVDEPNATVVASGTARVSNLPSHHVIDIASEYAPMQSTPNCFNTSVTSSDATKCLNDNSVQLNTNIDDAGDDAADDDDDNEDDDGAAGGDHDDILHDKIAEINAMKEQLKRLQDMMHTVKLIEIKNGDCPDPDANTDTVTANALNFNSTNATVLAKPLNDASIGEDPQRDDDEEQEMAERRRQLAARRRATTHTTAAPITYADPCNALRERNSTARVVDAADMLSLKSESSRGFSVPPPMRNIGTRDGPWRKSSQEMSRISSSAANNQPSHHQSFENAPEQHSPWYWQNGSCYNGQSYNATGPQSPHCHYYHHMGGSEPHYCRPACSVPPTMSASHISTGSNDPMLLQQFIQTQQMLINSMSQCNQLLWDQQREINNLNSTVLLVSLFVKFYCGIFIQKMCSFLIGRKYYLHDLFNSIQFCL